VNAVLRLTAFALVLAVVFVAALALGTWVGPVDGGGDRLPPRPAPAESPGHEGGHR
jgi:hypothetical protein